MDNRLAPLYSAEKVSSKVYEEVLRYLGYQVIVPTANQGRGPDVYWLSSEVAIMIERKEGKGGKAPPYSKKQVGQSFNHLE